MKKFFVPEDFDGPACLSRWVKFPSYEYDEILKFVTDRANTKLIKEGKIVYGFSPFPYKDHPSGNYFEPHTWTTFHQDDKTKYAAPENHKALLINIEPIEKCTHPADKCSYKWGQGIKLEDVRFPGPQIYEPGHWICECGAKVKPKEFEEI